MVSFNGVQHKILIGSNSKFNEPTTTRWSGVTSDVAKIRGRYVITIT